MAIMGSFGMLAAFRTLWEATRMPWLSAGTRHKGRLLVCAGLFPGMLLVVSVLDNFWVSPLLFLLNAGIMGAVLLLTWRYRDLVSERMLYVWQDPRGSQLVLSLNTYCILIFHLCPLLFLGTSQTVAEGLLYNVTGYFVIYLPVLESHCLLTSLLSLYAAAACPLVIWDRGTKFTVDMQRLWLIYIVSGSLLRLWLQSLQTRVTPVNLLKEKGAFQQSPEGCDEVRRLRHMECLVSHIRSREGRQSLARLLRVHRRRQDRKDELLAQFFWMSYAAAVRRLDQDVLQRVFRFLDASDLLYGLTQPPVGLLCGLSIISTLNSTASETAATTAANTASTTERLRRLLPSTSPTRRWP